MASEISVYVIAYDDEVYGTFATRSEAEESLAEQVAGDGPAWDSCEVQERIILLPPGSVLLSADDRREGMVTAYDYYGKYVGCIGSETWQRLLGGGTLLSADGVAQVREALEWAQTQTYPARVADGCCPCVICSALSLLDKEAGK